VLLAYPVREVFLRVAAVRGFWGCFLPLDLTMSTSMMFELFEWAAAELFGGELGEAYLGTQGADSLRVKDATPLGEDEIARMLAEKNG
jgi:putative membrane protein